MDPVCPKCFQPIGVDGHVCTEESPKAQRTEASGRHDKPKRTKPRPFDREKNPLPEFETFGVVVEVVVLMPKGGPDPTEAIAEDLRIRMDVPENPDNFNHPDKEPFFTRSIEVRDSGWRIPPGDRYFPLFEGEHLTHVGVGIVTGDVSGETLPLFEEEE